MGATALMTAEELLQLNLPDKRTELIRGRLVVRDPGGARHGAVAMQLGYRITAHVEAHDLGRVYAAETGFKIESDPDTVRAPDVGSSRSTGCRKSSRAAIPVGRRTSRWRSWPTTIIPRKRSRRSRSG